MSIGNEKYSVQNPLINYVCEPTAEYSTTDGKKIHLNLDWQYVSPEEAESWEDVQSFDEELFKIKEDK